MSKSKKLDIFNLFYSGAAVVILIGVIAKLLEWPAQDILITGGLAIEAVVFGVSAIKFIEVKKDTEVATEATLSKMAEGLGNLSSGGGVNLTGLSDGGVTSGYQLYDNIQPDYTESAWGLLEQMDVLTISKELFYHPSWESLKFEEYAKLSKLFKKLFDKKLTSKDALPFLIKFPVAFPKSDMDTLHLSEAQAIDLEEMEVLWKSFNIAGSNYLFEKAIIEDGAAAIMIRPRKENEIQIFGGESSEILAHIKNFNITNLVISPTQYYLSNAIALKNIDLVNYLIEKSSITNEQEVVSISSLLHERSDETKILFWNKFEKIVYNPNTGSGFLCLKSLIDTVLHFQNTKEGSLFLLNKLEVITSSNLNITRDDVINYPNDVVYFGKDNEYNVKLNELFTNLELTYKIYFESTIDKLTEDGISTKEALNHLFNLNKEDSVEDLLRILNRNLAKTNTAPTGAQLSFVLLCKVFINS